MSLPEHKAIRTALIPWIMAVIALIGLSALASVHRFTKKQESSHESAISELSDEVLTRGRVSDPLVFIEPAGKESGKPTVSYTLVPIIALPGAFAGTSFRAGKVQGRAPPELVEI